VVQRSRPHRATHGLQQQSPSWQPRRRTTDADAQPCDPPSLEWGCTLDADPSKTAHLGRHLRDPLVRAHVAADERRSQLQHLGA
jgi:hypothetical protein